MEVFIENQGKQAGPFTPEEIREAIANGLYQPSALVWYQGLSEWTPYSATPLNSSEILLTPPTSVPPTPTHYGQVTNSGLAIASMALGISSFLCGITAIPAVVCGHLARGQIKHSEGRLTGNGFATAGLVTGYLGLLIFVLAFVAGLTAPMVIRTSKKANQSEAVSNARQIGLALYEFQNEYGSYPNASTAERVAEDSGHELITDSTSNARFRQLFHAEITSYEEMFYAKISGIHRPDGDTSEGNILSPSECGFAYIEYESTANSSKYPLAVAPFVPRTDRFDPEPFDGKAIVLWSDSSVTSLPIDSGSVMFEGQDLLGLAHPVWDGKPFMLHLPEY